MVWYFRTLAADRFPNYVLTAVNSTDYSMKLKPSELIDLKRDVVQRTQDTIGNRIDQLGLAEKVVQQYGRAGADYEILVQLPGVDDPARVKELIGTAAVLEIESHIAHHHTASITYFRMSRKLLPRAVL